MADQYHINQLPRAAALKLVADRLRAVAAGDPGPVKAPEAYAPNRMAALLHPHCQHLKVKEIVEHSADVKSYLLAADPAAGTERLAWFNAGQYLAIALQIGDKTLTRPYSIASAPRDTLNGGHYRITVKRVPGGLASEYILDHWKVGDGVLASAPLGDFTYTRLRDAAVVVGIAGGSGITPFRSFARAIADGDEDFSLVLLYGSRTLADAVFSDEIKALSKSCPKIRLVNVLSEETREGCEHGFITAEVIARYAPEGAPYSVFLCGPQAMYDFADREIEKLGLRRKFVRHELFGEYFHPEKNDDYPLTGKETFTLTVKMAGKRYTVPCSADTSLLRAMEAAGIPAPSDCRSGRCGWCHSQLLSGEVYVPESVDGRRAGDLRYGYIHPCCSFPLSDVCLDVPPMPGL